MEFLLEYILFHHCASAFMWGTLFTDLVFVWLIYLCSLFSCILQSQNKYLTIQKGFLIFLPSFAPLTSIFLASRSTVRYPYSLWAVSCFPKSSWTPVDVLVTSGSSYQTVIYQPSEILAVPTGWLAWQKYNCSYNLYGYKPNTSRITWRKNWEGNLG